MKNSITGLYSTNNPNLGMGTGDKVVVDIKRMGYTRLFGRINCDYDGRLSVGIGTARYDGSSPLLREKPAGDLPSIFGMEYLSGEIYGTK